MLNPYTCDQCEWQYLWPMGDRVKAVKRHQLSHLLERRDASDSSVVEVPPYRSIDYTRERLQ